MLKRLIALAATMVVFAVGLFFAPSPNLDVAVGKAEANFTVRAVDQSVVCPGPLVRSGGQTGTKLGTFDLLGTAQLSVSAESDAGNLSLRQIDSKKSDSYELGSKRFDLKTSLANSAELTLAQPNANLHQGSFAMNAAQTQLAATDSLRGLASASCLQPSNDMWLVGGSTAVGRESILVLANPYPIDATADLRIFTDLGEVEVAGLSGISVTARSTNIISLASFAPTVSSLAVQVKSQGAKIAGWIQQKLVRGTSAQGVDFVTPVSTPSTSIIIPALTVRGAKQIDGLLERGDDFMDSAASIRVFAPEGANLTIQVISSDKEVFGAVFTDTIESGTVADFPLSDLRDGSYSVFIESDKPVFAAARSARANSSGSLAADFAWLAAAELITTQRVISVGDAGEATLTVANSSDEPATFTLKNLGTGSVASYQLGGVETLSVRISGNYAIESEAGVYAAATLLLEGGISSLQVLDPKNSGSEIGIIFR